ncbi:MAG TPA: heme exporter protein CcmD [Rhodocyclaceae bacterium]|jgi:heme exporter protein D|nr:heme exporter protein CcmD [Rhodocyclaceae bacterium]
MQWNSIGDFFAMGGYAFYVWGSFGVTALALLMEPLLLKKRRNDVLRSVRRERSAVNHSSS